jgi:regulator of protease activity HflC (stomatin/prohibitin superfamily)
MAKTLPLLALLLVAFWAASGITLVPIDARAIEERGGQPVRVLPPGLHAILPWPFGATRRVAFGQVHDLELAPGEPGGALSLVTAGGGAASSDARSPGTTILAATIHIFYRVGLSDAAAFQAAGSQDAGATSADDALVRAIAGRAVTRYCAARTLDALLSTPHATMAENLRDGMRHAMAGTDAGIDILAVTIAQLAPQSGAALAYEAARVAEIGARTQVAVAHGAAAVATAQARQRAFDLTSVARAAAAEAADSARAASIRFTADQAAARAGGPAFTLERYFASLVAALAHTPMTVIDHRLNWPEAPVLDLRSFAPPAAGGAGKEE